MDMNVDWIRQLIPDIDARVGPFTVGIEEMDDELVDIFINEVQRLADQMEQGLEINDKEIIRMAAHSLKGMGGTMGLPELSVLGLEVETRIKLGQFDPTRPLIKELSSWAYQLR